MTNLKETKILSIKPLGKKSTVYSFELDHGHVYVSNGFLSHNRCCVTGDTLVMTPRGELPITSLKLKDTVLSYDTETKEVKTTWIKMRVATLRPSHFKLEIGDSTLGITGDHPIYTQKGWAIIDDLAKANSYRDDGLNLARISTGDQVFSMLDSANCYERELKSMTEINQSGPVYTISVDNLSTPNFFANGSLVHNTHDGAVRRGGALSPDTMIATPEGQIRLSEVKLGDTVESYDVSQSKSCTATVYALVESIVGCYCNIQFTDGSCLKATETHPLYEATKGWVAIEPSYYADLTLNVLKIGDKLLSNNGSIHEVAAIDPIYGEMVQHTIGVEGTGTFIANGFVVHDGYTS